MTEPTKDLFNIERFMRPKTRITERGEALKELSEITGFSIPRICGMFPKATEKDFYYFLSDAKQARCGAKIALQHNAREWNGRNYMSNK